MVCQANDSLDPGLRRPRASWQLACCLSFRVSVGILGCFILLGSTGCNAFNFGSNNLVQELQSENERLLTEFRAERDRRQRTEEQLRVMENRLAESEKLIARQYSSSGQRLSQLSAPSGGSGYSLPASPGFTNSSSGGYGPADPESGLRWQRRASP